jgi:hypothetical protein
MRSGSQYVKKSESQTANLLNAKRSGKEATMDSLHLFLVVSAVIEVAILRFVAWCSANVAYSTTRVEETAKQIAEIANRNEGMTQDILQKGYEVRMQH